MFQNLHPDQQLAPRVRHTAMNMRMKKSYFLLLFAVCAAFRLLAQPVTATEHPILNTTQLDMQRTYDNLDSALANPEKVYKLTLTKQKIKMLPEEFGTLVNLQQLIISECKLKEIPMQIKSCKNLQMIVFSSNKIRVIPVEMRELKNLEILYLGKNKILEIPNWMGTLTKLRRLDISRNAITPADVANARRMLPKADVTY
jgi:Leucine-rich repeat (LRR) protein